MRMQKLLITSFCLIVSSLFSNANDPDELILSSPEQSVALSSEPSYLIGGVINPLSGQPVLRQTDLVAKGAQSIVLNRTYVPPAMPFKKIKAKDPECRRQETAIRIANTSKGWQYFPHLVLELHTKNIPIFSTNAKVKVVRLTDPNGITLDYQVKESKFTDCFSVVSEQYALSNAYGEVPSGKYDIRNTKVVVGDRKELITVYAPDGAIRYYEMSRRKHNERKYLLSKEILPNGKVLKYTYSDSRNDSREQELVRVDSLDPKERFVYATLHVKSPQYHENWNFTSNLGLAASCAFSKENFITLYNLKKVSSPFYRHETIGYNDTFLLTAYSGKENNCKLHYEDFGIEDVDYKVRHLQLPVGNQDSFISVYEMNYEAPIPGKSGGKTVVKNSDGISTIYHFSANLMTTLIQYLGQDGNLKKEKVFTWDEKNWLRSVEMRDCHGNSLHKRSYEFDTFGNPILEVFTGHLSGISEQESYMIKREYSQDGRNLLLSEQYENGKVYAYAYLPNTNLIAIKFTKDHDRIILREFYEYSDYHQLIQKIVDDGCSSDKNDLNAVSQRFITYYNLRDSQPFLHMPTSIQENYVENGIEKQIRFTKLYHDQYGNINQEDVYDANNQFAYSIYKEYNERGDLLNETNPLKQKASYKYDAKGLQTEFSNFSGRLKKNKRYDAQRRLRQEDQLDNDNTVRSSFFTYDNHDRLVQKVNSYNHGTTYAYDLVNNKVVRTEGPPITSGDGLSTVATSSTCDSFGREITKISANGHVSHYRYNAYESPIEIIYANGSREHFLYEKNGDLAQHTNQDGLTTTYVRDVLGRVLSKIYSFNGENLAKETFTYSGFNLLGETNREGHTRYYSYDGAGRKIREEFCGRVTEFSYNPLGQLCTIRRLNEENTLLIHYVKDLENRITEETRADSSGKLLTKINYAYDEDGNKKTITRQINGHEAIENFSYDSLGRLIEHQDPYQHVTKTSYDERHINSLGQYVLKTTTVDPLNITTVKIYDPYDHIIRKEVLSTNGLQSCQEMIYDPAGNVILRKDHVISGGNCKSIQSIGFVNTYDNQIESITRAFGTPSTRITSYTYTLGGKVHTKTLPDGVKLFYQYNPFGSLFSLKSSDQKIDHSFTYNKLENLTAARDHQLNIAITREVDPFGNVISEKFPSGLEVKKQYDSLNRLTQLQLPNQEEVLYKYDSLFLKSVTKFSHGKEQYSHIYEDYDLDGNLLSEKLIGGLGPIDHQLDLNGKKTEIKSPYFTQKCHYDAIGNLTHNNEGKDIHYAYDDLSQLIQENSSNYAYDSLHNRTHKENEIIEVNELNEIKSHGSARCSYDLNGNLILKETYDDRVTFAYDTLNQLVEVISKDNKVVFTYDPLGRRLSKSDSKTTENTIYHGQNEIGAYDEKNQPINLRILNIAKNPPTTIAIEIGKRKFAPIVDVQGNIRRLIDLETKQTANSYEFTAFGEDINAQESIFNPWRYASKRYDPETGLIYYGKRYYDPEFARWLTTDPAGFADSANLYQTVFNNPFRYHDPDGQFAMFVPLLIPLFEIALPTLTLALPTMTQIGMAVGLAAAATAGYEFSRYLNRWDQSRSHYDYYMPSEVLEEEEKKTAEEKATSKEKKEKSKRHDLDQQALNDLVKKSGKRKISQSDADTLLEWAEEYDFPARDDRGETHWRLGEHIHIGHEHVPVKK